MSLPTRDASLGRRGVGAVLLAAVVALALLGLMSVRHARRQAESAHWVAHTHEVIEQLERIRSGLAEAESAVRGYAISRDASFLDGFEPALAKMVHGIERARQLTADNTDQHERLAYLAQKVERRVGMFRAHAARARAGPVDVPAGAHALGLEIASETGLLVAVERELLTARDRETRERTNVSVLTSIVTASAATALIVATMILLRRELTRRESAERQLTDLLRFADLLQACRTTDEAFAVGSKAIPQFFSRCSGALSTFHASRNIVETRVDWGEAETMAKETCFEPHDCWALRRGRPYLATDSEDLRCNHFGENAPPASLCVPLTAHGEVVGVLHLMGAVLPRPNEAVATAVAEQLAMALANLQLRETLRNQSIRDPLTGLFNRRYTEETLRRELRRAERAKEPLGVLMIDVDHFKRCNDTFGHDGGDAILRAIATVLESTTRASDVVSRMGGEELVVLLPGAGAEASAQKADALRKAVEELRPMHEGRVLGPVTISVGVSAYPLHGISGEELFRVADAALYAAKRGGRNRVCTAEHVAGPP